jgi:molybdenum cofactor cytidylyltransferase
MPETSSSAESSTPEMPSSEPHMVKPLPETGIVILAAGASTRLGQPKQLLTYKGRSLLAHACESALASLCDPVIVVLGARAAQIKAELAGLPVQIAENAGWEAGMGSSIRVGVQKLLDTTEVDAVILMLCDQPFVSAHTINKLIQVHQATNQSIVASRYSDTLGVPALFAASHFQDLMALEGEKGARVLFKKYPEEIALVTFEHGNIDIDTAQDYQRLQEPAM